MKDQQTELENAAAAAQTGAPAPAEDPLAALRQERDRLAAENADLQDRLLRRVAEFENFRRRVEREKAEIREFAAMEVERVPAAGQKFDPNIHHAIEMRQTEEAEDHSVLEELQKGYTFRGRLLRPAMVRVAVAPPKDSGQDQRTDG
jgi:molecular chaperone GrpE